MNKDNKDTPKSYCLSLEMGLPCGCQSYFGKIPSEENLHKKTERKKYVHTN